MKLVTDRISDFWVSIGDSAVIDHSISLLTDHLSYRCVIRLTPFLSLVECVTKG